MRTQVHRSSPKVGKQLALDAHMFDVTRVLGRFDRRNYLVQFEANGGFSRRVEGHFLWLAKEVAWSRMPLLAFSAVHRQFEGMAIGSMEGVVTVQQCLHPVFSWRD